MHIFLYTNELPHFRFTLFFVFFSFLCNLVFFCIFSFVLLFFENSVSSSSNSNTENDKNVSICTTPKLQNIVYFKAETCFLWRLALLFLYFLSVPYCHTKIVSNFGLDCTKIFFIFLSFFLRFVHKPNNYFCIANPRHTHFPVFFFLLLLLLLVVVVLFLVLTYFFALTPTQN